MDSSDFHTREKYCHNGDIAFAHVTASGVPAARTRVVLAYEGVSAGENGAVQVPVDSGWRHHP
jgi:hypothetical protein